MNKKILVIGAFGFMGKNIIKVFNNTKYNIFQESRKTGLDLCNYESTFKKIKSIQPDIIINCAAHVGSMPYVAKFSADVIYDNSLMYLTLYKVVNDINKNILIINPISNCSYPGVIDIQNEENWWDGKIHDSVESYGMPKKLGFILSECYRKQYGLKTLNLIIPNAYGPDDYNDSDRTHAMNGIILRMLKSLQNKETTFNVWGSGTPIREWIFMPDVANLIKLIIDEEKFNLPNPLNFGQEHGISIKETVNIIKSKLNCNMNLYFDLSKPDGAPIKILGNKHFYKIFNNYKFTSYDDGIEQTIKYYKEIL